MKKKRLKHEFEKNSKKSNINNHKLFCSIFSAPVYKYLESIKPPEQQKQQTQQTQTQTQSSFQKEEIIQQTQTNMKSEQTNIKQENSSSSSPVPKSPSMNIPTFSVILKNNFIHFNLFFLFIVKLFSVYFSYYLF